MHAKKREAVEKFIIRGGSTVAGNLIPMGSKNEALPAIAATLLACEPVTLRNVPEIRDCHVMFEILQAMGAAVERPEENTYVVDTRDVEDWRLPRELCSRIRASILFAGPMLARKGRVELPPPGGDVIGRRRLDTHLDGMVQLGAKLNTGKSYVLEAQKLKGADLFLDEASVTATENLLMVAARARGTTTIRNAACEPHVQGLAKLLGAMGAKIDGIGTNLLTIEGVTTVVAKLFHIVSPDRAYFGQKDAQQLAVVRRMVTDLDMNLEVIACETVREHDGLALSSRNVYLSAAARIEARCLSEALFAARDAHGTGERDAAKLRALMTHIIQRRTLPKIDYVSLADSLTLREVTRLERPVLASLAVRFGATRLIDNILLTAVGEAPASLDTPAPSG